MNHSLPVNPTMADALMDAVVAQDLALCIEVLHTHIKVHKHPADHGSGSLLTQGRNTPHRSRGYRPRTTLGSALGRALLKAAELGAAPICRLLVLADADVNHVEGRTARTPLFVAAEHGQAEATAALLATDGVGVNRPGDASGCTPLCVAARGGHAATVAALLGHRLIDANLATTDGSTPLHAAASTPLHAAAFHGHVDVVAALLAAGGVDANRSDSIGATPLYAASARGHPAVVAALLATDGVDANQADANGATPLCVWGTAHNPSRVQCEGARTGTARLVATSPRGVVTSRTAPPQNTKLISPPFGWDVHPGRHVAAEGGHTAVIHALLAAPSLAANQALHDGSTPLHVAAGMGHVGAVAALLAVAGVRAADQADAEGTTPLYLAAQNGHGGTVAALLAARVDPDQPDREGATPLIIACKNNHAGVAAALLDHGADPHVEDGDRDTALKCAQQHGFERKLTLRLEPRAEAPRARKKRKASPAEAKGATCAVRGNPQLPPAAQESQPTAGTGVSAGQAAAHPATRVKMDHWLGTGKFAASTITATATAADPGVSTSTAAAATHISTCRCKRPNLEATLFCDGCDGVFALCCTGLTAVPQGDTEWRCTGCLQARAMSSHPN